MKPLIQAAAVAAALLATSAGSAGQGADTSGLPQEVRAMLDHKYPGWRLYDLASSDPKEVAYCAVGPDWSSFVRGDFNQDGKPDYAALVEYQSTGYAVAFIKRAKGYQFFPIFPASAKDRGYPNYIAPAARGSLHFNYEHKRDFRARTDGVTLIFCESSRATYFFTHNKFVATVEGD